MSYDFDIIDQPWDEETALRRRIQKLEDRVAELENELHGRQRTK